MLIDRLNLLRVHKTDGNKINSVLVGIDQKSIKQTNIYAHHIQALIIIHTIYIREPFNVLDALNLSVPHSTCNSIKVHGN